METAISVGLPTLSYQRKILCRFVFAFIFLFLLYYLYSNTLVHQLHSPVLVYPYVDITYWIFHALNIPEFITQHYFIACCFDLLLFITCITSFLFPGKRFFVLVFFVLFAVYYIIFNSYGTQHTHSKIGILLVPIPLMLPVRMFSYLWEALRYFTLFMYADAFLWKVYRFNFFEEAHSLAIVKKNFAAYLLYHQESIGGAVYTWLLNHPGDIHFLFIMGLILEGCFIIGFFTKKADKYLFIISILLPFGFFFLSDAFFFEMLVLSFTLIKVKLKKYQPSLVSLVN